MYRNNGRILEGACDRHESNEAKVTIIVNDVRTAGMRPGQEGTGYIQCLLSSPAVAINRSP
jgi:hypothetical protein